MLYAYAVDGQQATSTQQGSPLIGSIQAYEFLVTQAALLPQTVTFGTIATQTVGTTLTLTATASSNLTVVYTSKTTSIRAVSGQTASFLTAGTCSITASQPGDNSTYAAATPVTQAFSVTPTPASSLGFTTLLPCRLVDTRSANGPFGGPSLGGGSTRVFVLPSGACGIPANASAYSLKVTVIPKALLNYLTIWPTGELQPLVSTLNSLDGRVVANAADVAAGTAGAISVYASDQTDLVIDVNGYSTPSSSNTLSFVPVTPCRVADTRNATGPLGGPILGTGQTRDFPVPSSACSIPATAVAYSLNATVVPTADLSYLSLYPTGTTQPTVSTLNSLNGHIVANAAIVTAGTNGSITAYVTDETELILDINGYFTTTSTTPLVFNTVIPCRIADTRDANGPFGGPIMAAGSTRSFAIPASTCAIPSSAAAYALNLTVVPTNTLGYLTIWPDGQVQPYVSTLNSHDGQVVANAAIVPAGNAGAVDVFVTDKTHVIIDIVGYFRAP